MSTKKAIADFLNEIKGYGFTALAAAGIAVGLFIFGHPFLAGISAGVFFTRNWDIIEKYVKEYVSF